MILVARQWTDRIRSFLLVEKWEGIDYPYQAKFCWIAEMDHQDNLSAFVEIDYDAKAIDLKLERRRDAYSFSAGKRIRIENFESFVDLFNAAD